MNVTVVTVKILTDTRLMKALVIMKSVMMIMIMVAVMMVVMIMMKFTDVLL